MSIGNLLQMWQCRIEIIYFIFRHNLVPIVMGAHPLDYAALAPPNSFIHVDWFSGPQSLAKYLLELDRDDARYNKYFAWKNDWEPLIPPYHCQLCFLAQFMRIESIRYHYEDIEYWLHNDSSARCIGQGRWVDPLDLSLLPA